jgi:class 3 adenylate cyclase
VYQVWAVPRNLLGWLAIPFQIGMVSARCFGAVFREYDRVASVPQKTAVSLLSGPTQVRFTTGGEQRLEALKQNLLREGADAPLLERLVETLAREDDMEVQRLRPYALADAWGAPRRSVLELCLLATRAGLLEFSWDLLCPLCRGAKVRSPSLGGLVPRVHCDTCNIDFSANFERSVELKFRPNPSIRPASGGEYCIAGPQITPHVVVQQLLAPGERRMARPRLQTGRYRLRALELPGGQFFQVAGDGLAAVELKVDGRHWPEEEWRLVPEAELRFANATEGEQLFILERTAWSDQAATAAEVTALQRFRDLFSREALRPGERISVGSLAILFTDLSGSTRMYNQMGDAPAFGLVMEHFDVLLAAVAEEDGAVVKTIGDAVMAVFRRPVGALRALWQARQRLASTPGGVNSLRLKAGVHYGPCIAVTLNERLDYFGSTVNMASRLEHLSQGGEVVISAAVHDDPEVVEFLAQNRHQLHVEVLETTLKGFDEARFALWRVQPVGAAG